MIVCIAEKPSVARDIADVLGARDKRDGYIEGNGYQENQRTWYSKPRSEMGVTCVGRQKIKLGSKPLYEG